MVLNGWTVCIVFAALAQKIWLGGVLQEAPAQAQEGPTAAPIESISTFSASPAERAPWADFTAKLGRSGHWSSDRSIPGPTAGGTAVRSPAEIIEHNFRDRELVMIVPYFISQSGNNTTTFRLPKGWIMWMDVDLQISVAAASGIFQATLRTSGAGSGAAPYSGGPLSAGLTLLSCNISTLTGSGAISDGRFLSNLKIPVDPIRPLVLSTTDTGAGWINLNIGVLIA